MEHDFCGYQINCICQTCKNDSVQCCQNHPQIDCPYAHAMHQDCPDYEGEDAPCS